MASGPAAGAAPGGGALSPRELEVLRLAARGVPQRAIGAALGLTLNTVKTHLRRAVEKLGAADRGEALRRAAAAGLVPAAPRAAGRSPLLAEVLRLATATGRLPRRGHG